MKKRSAFFTPVLDSPPFILLENRLDLTAPARLYTRPARILRCADPAELSAIFDALDQGLAQGLHAAGLLAYELGHALEPKLAPLLQPGTPLLWLGLFRPPTLIDQPALDAFFARLPPPEPLARLRPSLTEDEHAGKIRRLLALIRAGDIYQANLTFKLQFHTEHALALYAAMRASQPTAYGGFARLEDGTRILSLSPELFIDIENHQATTRPMKGTAARGATQAADAQAAAILQADPKQRAENLMITDLLRNDLSRIAAPGSVRVPALFTLETYPSFHALTSTITAQVRPDTTLHQRLAALFPCGSIVGAPKIHAAEIIAGLEEGPRGFYTGSLGVIAPGGDLDFNVAIRTAIIRADGTGSYGTGGGIVADSQPAAEYQEALLKARVLTQFAAEYELIETFGWFPAQGFPRLAGHLNRMQASAAALGFAFDRTEAEAHLARFAHTASAPARLRLSLSRAGRLTLVHAALIAQPPLIVALAAARLDPGDPFLRHKTTRRAVYDQTFAKAEAAGYTEALFLNRRGELAEACRATLFIEIDGRLATPPLTAGVLPGVLRQELLESGRAFERILTVDDLQLPIFLGSSLRGLRPASTRKEGLLF